LIEFPLVTERLLLRPMKPGDEDGLHAVWSHPDVLAALEEPAPWPRPASRHRLEAKMAHQERHGFAVWAVLERDGSRLVGETGLQLLDGGPEVEVGWRIHPDVQRRGYATEAAGAAIAAGLEQLGLERVVAVADPGNTASRRVMEKLGMTYVGPRRVYGRDMVLYEICGSG
jgi:[ribosomal protein S5]-alanine N-acetyltransferase